VPLPLPSFRGFCVSPWVSIPLPPRLRLIPLPREFTSRDGVNSLCSSTWNGCPHLISISMFFFGVVFPPLVGLFPARSLYLLISPSCVLDIISPAQPFPARELPGGVDSSAGSRFRLCGARVLRRKEPPYMTHSDVSIPSAVVFLRPSAAPRPPFRSGESTPPAEMILA